MYIQRTFAVTLCPPSTQINVHYYRLFPFLSLSFSRSVCLFFSQRHQLENDFLKISFSPAAHDLLLPFVLRVRFYTAQCLISSQYISVITILSLIFFPPPPSVYTWTFLTLASCFYIVIKELKKKTKKMYKCTETL